MTNNYLGMSLVGCLLTLSARSEVTYEQFGAVGDGKTDDRAAIVKAHATANETGELVRATDGKTYYLGPVVENANVRRYIQVCGERNYSKNILFDHVEFSRFDAHMGVANATIRKSRLGHMGINAIGCGTFRVEDTEIRGPAVFNLRGDYGSTWEGDFVVKNCRLVPNGLRGGQPYLIRGSYTGKHDFGYVCHMPRKITVDGLVIDDAKAPKDYGGPYIFENFNKENSSADYVEDYPYQLTEEVVLKNVTTTSGKPVRVSPNKWMFRNVKVVR